MGKVLNPIGSTYQQQPHIEVEKECKKLLTVGIITLIINIIHIHVSLNDIPSLN